MAVINQEITNRFAIYNGDCVEVMQEIPDNKIGLTVYSPPFGGLFRYSSDERDLSNCVDYGQFFEHYAFVVEQIARITMPGRMSCVHCMDVPSGNTGTDHMIDFPGDIIRLHKEHGMDYVARYSIWKEPLGVRNRTMAKNLAHKTIVDDSSRCSNAAADYLLVFRKRGANPEAIAHPIGLLEYAGERLPPADILKYRGWTGNQIENRYSHWIWRQYASAFWDDIRIGRTLPFNDTERLEDGENHEKHVHPLQLDVIDRAIVLWSNPDDTVLTPFMGVGSEVYGAVMNGRKGVGIELKSTYFAQAILNCRDAYEGRVREKQMDMFEDIENETEAAE